MNSYKPRNILVTGGAGFIGANFIRYLLGQTNAIQLINLDLLTYAGSLDNLKNLPNAACYQFIQGDICDQALINTLLRQYCIDTIVHFAAESHVDRSIEGPAAFVQTNIIGTFNLLENARQYWQDEMQWDDSKCRFHHISTDEVYGTLAATDPPFTEQSPYAPNSPYSASKAGSDHLVRAYFHTYQLPITMSNCSNNYGPYQHTEKLIPKVIANCLQQKPVPIYGDGTHIRDWLYVVDHCAAIWQIIQQGRLGENYNIGGNNEWSNLELVRLICRLMDELYPQHQPHADLITFVHDRPGHDWRYAIDINKMQAELNWLPTTDFTKGLTNAIAFYAKK